MKRPSRLEILEYALSGAKYEQVSSEWNGYEDSLEELEQHIKWLEREIEKAQK